MAKLNKINLSGTEILLEQLSSYIRILEPDENGNLDWANMEDGVWYLLPIGVRLGGYDNGTFSTSGFTDYNKNGLYYEAENLRLNTIRILCVNKYPSSVCYTKMIWFVPNASFSTADSWGMGIMVGKSSMKTYTDASLPAFDVTTGLLDVNCLLNSNHTVEGQWIFNDTTKIPKLGANAVPSNADHITNKTYVDTELATKQDDLNTYLLDYDFSINASPTWYNGSSELGILYMNKLNELYHKGIYNFVIRLRRPSTKNIYFDIHQVINPTTHTINQATASCVVINFNGEITRRYAVQTIYTGLSYDSVNDEFTHSGNVVATFWYSGSPYMSADSALAKNNTTAYTPTQQYHPATKGYVDSYINSFTFLDNLPLVLCDYAGMIQEYDSSQTYYKGDIVKNGGSLYCAYVNNPGDLVSGGSDWFVIDPMFYVKSKVFHCSPWNYSVDYDFQNMEKVTQYECRDYNLDTMLGDMLNYAEAQGGNQLVMDPLDPFIFVAEYPYKDEIASGSTIWYLQQDGDEYYFDCGNNTTITWKQLDMTPENYWVRITRREPFSLN